MSNGAAGGCISRGRSSKSKGKGKGKLIPRDPRQWKQQLVEAQEAEAAEA